MKDCFILGSNQLDNEFHSPRTHMKRSNILSINKEHNRNPNQKTIVKNTKSFFRLIKTPKRNKAEVIIVLSEDNQKSMTERCHSNRRKILKLYEDNLYKQPQQNLSPQISKASKLKNYYSSLEQSNSNLTNKAHSNKKPRVLLLPTSQDRHNIIECKQTEADSSYDKVISTSLWSSFQHSHSVNKIQVIPEIKRSSPIYNRYNKLPTIPQPTNDNYILTANNIKRSSGNILLPQKNNIFKLFLTNKSSKNTRMNIGNQFNEFDHNNTTNCNEDNIIDDHYEISPNKINTNSEEDCSETSDSGAQLIKSKTSQLLPTHMSNYCTKNKMKILCIDDKCIINNKIQYNNNNDSQSKLHISKFIGKLSKLMPNDYINIIDKKFNTLKQESLRKYCFGIESKVDSLLTRTLSRDNSKFSVSNKDQRLIMMGNLLKNIKSSETHLHQNGFVYNHYCRINSNISNIILINFKVSLIEMKIIFQKYDNQLYSQILNEYASIRTNSSQSLISHIINNKENKLNTNKLLKIDFIASIFDNNNNRSLSQIKSQDYYTSMINKVNPYLRKIWNNESSILKPNIKKPKQNNQKNDKDTIMLHHDTFYSREDFNINKLEQITKDLELVPRCKAKNIKFKLVDEQEEMKKNKNMSKESLVFRTQELKLKIKDKLETLEEILFFLLKEMNFKEFKKIFEQFQMPLEYRDKEGNTLLIYAVECSFLECIIYLIQKGADINAQNYMLNTPLHIAMLYKNYEIADILLKNGADERIINKNHLTPWQCLSFLINKMISK